VWADVMSAEFLRQAASNFHKAILGLLNLWQLKASTVCKDWSFNVLDDFKNAALDAIWVVIIGDEPGVTRYETEKLRRQIEGQSDDLGEQELPRGTFIRKQVAYISETIARNFNSLSPNWIQKLEAYTPRYRRFRATVTTEINKVMEKVVDRFRRLESGGLEADDIDTYMMDLVLRRHIAEAKKA
jgi:hypothetical protein